ncbi:outer membrane lipoprotein carrier protein LolA [Virgibacillus sp. W0430]|uniref:LolA family protein n=1 Tax=Virgibacillus sp. W0430 TaxID=3391580 RepID=UPI003F45B821
MGRSNNRLFILISFVLILVLAACGEKSQESVVKNLEESIEEMNGYKAQAVMKMNTGQEEQKYEIDVWHKKEDLYRVTLSNDKDEKGEQVILKNKDGVFVITPALKKSFKFQTEWPDNSSQPYLYQSLVRDVIEDKEATFETTETNYVFKTKTNYQSNNNLPYQEIYFNKKSYAPELVKVLDKDGNALVEVTFSSFEVNPSFGEKDFEMDEDMSNNQDEEASATVSEQDYTLEVIFPLETVGSELVEKKEVDLENGKRVILTFEGEKNFTLIQEKRDDLPVLSMPKDVKGDIVNIGQAIGALTENAIEWSENGVDYYLASEELTKEELIQVAASVQGREVK